MLNLSLRFSLQVAVAVAILTGTVVYGRTVGDIFDRSLLLKPLAFWKSQVGRPGSAVRSHGSVSSASTSGLYIITYDDSTCTSWYNAVYYYPGACLNGTSYSCATTSGEATATSYANTDCTGSSIDYTISVGNCTAVDTYLSYQLTCSAPTEGSYATKTYYSDSSCSTPEGSSLYRVDSCIIFNSTASVKVSCGGSSVSAKGYTGVSCSGSEFESTSYSTDKCSATNDDDFIDAKASKYSCVSSSSSSRLCFAGSELVQLEIGSAVAISKLKVGDRVATLTSDDKIEYSDVVFIPHLPNDIAESFIEVSTDAGKSLLVTAAHLVMTADCATGLKLKLAQAKSLVVGACVRTIHGSERVAQVSRKISRGLYTAVPLNGGYLLVNGIAASPFAISHHIPNTWYNMHRAVYNMFPSFLANEWIQVLQDMVVSPLVGLTAKALGL